MDELHAKHYKQHDLFYTNLPTVDKYDAYYNRHNSTAYYLGNRFILASNTYISLHLQEDVLSLRLSWLKP